MHGLAFGEAEATSKTPPSPSSAQQGPAYDNKELEAHTDQARSMRPILPPFCGATQRPGLCQFLKMPGNRVGQYLVGDWKSERLSGRRKGW
jgi:hypothetical protein